MSPDRSVIGRRSLGIAAWLGGMALALPATAAETMGRDAARPTVFGVWTLIAQRTYDTQIRLAGLGDDGQPSHAPVLATVSGRDIGSLADLTRRSREFVRAEIACRWGVPVRDCRFEGGTIIEVAGARKARVVEWTDFV